MMADEVEVELVEVSTRELKQLLALLSDDDREAFLTEIGLLNLALAQTGMVQH
jgi:hypothetical protein